MDEENCKGCDECEQLPQFIGVKIVGATPMTRDVAETKHGVKVGGSSIGAGYLVDYQNGYKSWSPTDVFEEAYRPIDSMTFGLAIEAMKKGNRVARKGWNGKGIYIEIQTPDANSKMSSPYIYIDTTGLQTDNPDAPRSLVPWLASQTDMLAEDWQIF